MSDTTVLRCQFPDDMWTHEDVDMVRAGIVESLAVVGLDGGVGLEVTGTDLVVAGESRHVALVRTILELIAEQTGGQAVDVLGPVDA